MPSISARLLCLWLLGAFAPAPLLAQAQEPERVVDWQIAKAHSNITAVDGVLNALGTRRGWIRSKRGVNDLSLRLEFRLLTEDATGAVIVRAWTDRTDSWAQAGYRVALRAGAAGRESTGHVTGLSKRVEPLSAPAAIASLPLASWHVLEVEAVGDTVRVRLNGQVVQHVRGEEPPAGVIGIEVTRGHLEVRNVWMTPVVPEMPADVIREPKNVRGLVMPRVRRQVKPRYTEDAMTRGITGQVKLEAIINADGSVQQAWVTQSLYPDLDTEAIAAVRRWTFHPATVDGKPVPIVAAFEMTFTLHERFPR